MQTWLFLNLMPSRHLGCNSHHPWRVAMAAGASGSWIPKHMEGTKLETANLVLWSCQCFDSGRQRRGGHEMLRERLGNLWLLLVTSNLAKRLRGSRQQHHLTSIPYQLTTIWIHIGVSVASCGVEFQSLGAATEKALFCVPMKCICE